MKAKLIDFIRKQNQNVIAFSNKLIWKGIDLRPFVLGIGFFLIITAILATNFLPQTVRGIELGKPSPETIKAPRSIEFVNHEKTEELEEQAAKNVEPVYQYDVMVAPRVEKNIQEFFSSVKDAQANESLDSDAKLKFLKEKIEKKIPNDVLKSCLAMTPEELQLVEDKTSEITKRIMSARIKKTDLTNRKKEFVNIVEDFDLASSQSEVIEEIGTEFLEPNYVLDLDETAKERVAAMAEVQPYAVKKVEGEIVVREGEIVTPEQKMILEKLGLLKSGMDILKILGTALMVLVIILALGIYLYSYQHKIYTSPRKLLVLGMLLAVTILIAKIINPYFAPILIPIAGLAMLVTMLFSPQLAVVILLIASLLTSIIVGSDIQYLSVALLSGVFAVFLVSKITERKNLVQAGFLLSIVLAGLSFIVNVIDGNSFIEIFKSSGWGALSGMTSAVFAAGTLPFVEIAFNITTDTKLLELSNPNQPLLRELMMTAPGTYNHSIVIGNLAESAAEAVGANPLLTRAGGYYHDIGKIKRPFFFVENQIGDENPHDKTKPNLSYLIITAHVKDGIELAKKYKLPREIISIIREHHGTTVVTYFYHRAQEIGDKQFVNEEDYRYHGDTPHSKEAALVLLADAVEAASRTVPKASPARFEQLVRKIVQNRIDDGQLDDSNLTLTDLKKIVQIFSQTLTSMYHGRVEYPTSDVVPLKRKTHGGSGK